MSKDDDSISTFQLHENDTMENDGGIVKTIKSKVTDTTNQIVTAKPKTASKGGGSSVGLTPEEST